MKIQYPIEPVALSKIAEQIATEPFPRAIDYSLGDGVTTCLFHRAWEWALKWYAPLMPKCEFCGGRCDPRLTAHHLCRERNKRGMATPRLDSFHKCGCARCKGGK